MADLAGLIAKQGSDLRLRQAIVTAVPSGGTCTIRFGDLASTTVADDIAGVHYLSGVGINNGDTVHVLQTGGALLIVGRVAGAADAWLAWSPPLTQPGIVPTTVNYGRVTKIDRTVIAECFLTVTGTGTAASNVLLGLPFPSAGNGAAYPLEVGSGLIFDSSLNQAWKGNAILVSTIAVVFRASGSSPGVLGTTDFTAALAPGDNVSARLIYESAS